MKFYIMDFWQRYTEEREKMKKQWRFIINLLKEILIIRRLSFLFVIFLLTEKSYDELFILLNTLFLTIMLQGKIKFHLFARLMEIPDLIKR